MLSRLTLTNFKAFSDGQSIRIAPITMLFGQNSSGKSSVLQSLYLLLQTLNFADRGMTLLFRARHAYTDLGNYQEMLFGHDSEQKQMRIRLDVTLGQLPEIPKRIREWFDSGISSLGLELAFDMVKRDLKLTSFTLHANEEHEPLAAFVRRVDDTSKQETFECNYLTDSPTIWNYALSKVSEDLVWLESEIDREVAEDAKDGVEEHSEQIRLLLATLREFAHRSHEFLKEHPDLNSYIAYQRDTTSLRTISGQRWFLPGQPLPSFLKKVTRSAPIWDEDFEGTSGDWIDVETEIVEDFSLQHLISTRFIPHALDVGELVELVAYIIERNLKATCPIGPLRERPSRTYLFSGVTPVSVGFEGADTPEILYRRDELLSEINTWLDEHLDAGYVLETLPIHPSHGGMFEIRVKDCILPYAGSTNLADVGFGITQILPIIAQSLLARNQLILVEQPELHIHPGLQARMGTLFAETTRQSYGNTFLIETHSEHLVLRLQRLVRDGKLKPEDVSVNYVQRGPMGSTIQELRLDAEGEFIDNWPGGFFPERLRELIE